jgi:hypothetical protein
MSVTTAPTPARTTRLRQGPARIDALALAILAAALAFVLTTVIRSPLKDDIAWLLWVSEKWLDGQELYIDLVEVNPPLVVWLYAIPAGLAQWLDLAPKFVATAFFAAILLACAWWTATLLRGRAKLLERPVPVFSLIATLLLVLPGVEFGQREHLLAAVMLPYIALFVRALDGEREPLAPAAIAGCIAALGCAMKPSYGLALLLLEVIGVLRGHRRLRMAPLAFVATTGLYGLAVLAFEPAFLTKAVPMALAIYGGTDTPVAHILLESRTLLVGQAVALLLCWHGRAVFGHHAPFLRQLFLALVAVGTACTVLFVLQGKDWFYHSLPATTATVLALILWTAAALAGPAIPWRRPALALAAMALLVFAVANVQRLRPWVAQAVEPQRATEEKLVALLKREKARTYIAFSEWIGLGFPVVNDTGVFWASRFDSMWALKGELWKIGQDGRAPKQWPIRRWVARDFIVGCPDIAVVDTREGTDYIGVLVASDEEFARAWSQYREIAFFDGLRILKRDEFGCDSEPLPPGRQPLATAAPSE